MFGSKWPSSEAKKVAAYTSMFATFAWINALKKIDILYLFHRGKLLIIKMSHPATNVASAS